MPTRPTWQNMVEGQLNLIDAIDRSISFDNPDGRTYRLNEETATLLVRPRGWHLPEKHIVVDGSPIAGAFMDFGLYFFHNARRLLERGSGPYFYLPKLEGHREARLWNDVFSFAQDALGIPRGSIKATVLLEVVISAYEMDEILYELRDHSAGLNAGRWDYIFSIIKKFSSRPDFLTPDRAQITMTVPFMRAYTELLVKTCHKRGAFAMGGMAAFIPSRRDPKVNEVALPRVRDDKLRESRDGFDGTWVAHPDLVPIAREVFSDFMGDKANQIDRQRPEVSVEASDLLDLRVPGRRDHRSRPAQQRERRHPVHRVVAARHGRGGDLQSDGGRRHRRDLALPGVAVGASRRAAVQWPAHHTRAGAADRRRRAGATARVARGVSF